MGDIKKTDALSDVMVFRDNAGGVVNGHLVPCERYHFGAEFMVQVV